MKKPSRKILLAILFAMLLLAMLAVALPLGGASAGGGAGGYGGYGGYTPEFTCI